LTAIGDPTREDKVKGGLGREREITAMLRRMDIKGIKGK
jgi:hypothetical protein